MNVFVFGEVLWDIYPGQRVIGGAPFNFAAHLSRLGTPAYLVSAVGTDELGKSTRSRLRDMGVMDEYTSDAPWPTGVCEVSVSADGMPSYTLLREVAYDYIALTERQLSSIASGEYGALYFGTLAQRGEVSRSTLSRLLGCREWGHVFFDINIRQSFYGRDVIEQGLRACTILKFSREEAWIFERLGLTSLKREAYTHESPYLEALCVELSQEYGIGTVLLTLDKDGAKVYEAERGAFLISDKPNGNVVSSVGAGDSFSACYLHFALSGAPAGECLRKAVVLSSYVVGQLESIPDYSPALKKELGII